MTNGTSQGLFVIVAIVIFSIFIAISYLLFRNTLKPTLANIFTDGLEQANCQFNPEETNTIKCNPTFNNSFDFKSLLLTFSGWNGMPKAWEHDASYILTIDLNKYPDVQINQETNTVTLERIDIWGLTKDKAFTSENGYTKNNDTTLTLTVNQDKPLEYNKAEYSNNMSWKTFSQSTNYQPQLAINQINTFKIELENAYGGKSVKTIQVKIIYS
ncbi:MULTISPECIES: hypothetical protein [Enterococcus]|uniref:hypothetical protein n=1 Tax=Enterococcus TaxID=1350 RepID=UPI000664DDA0|nr:MULTISPECIES: hypothetical protein [Enterococcus]MDQ8608395.1 hypothetical protein [Enterococcus sp. FR133]